MKRKHFLFSVLFLLILLTAQIYVTNGQITSAEIAQRQELEEFLKTADIVKSKDIGEGVTKPIKLYLKKGDTEGSGCWKNPKGMQKGFLEGWQYEIAAYEMDKLIGLNMVPTTVEREFKGERGSLQLWIEKEYSLLEIMEQGIKIPVPKLRHTGDMKYLTRAFDCLIANDDRTQQNIIYTKDWRMILIDHSRSFRSSKEFTERLVYGKYGLKAKKFIRRLPRVFVEKIKTLDFNSIKNAVGSYLTEKEINAILIRNKLLLEEIQEMIEEQGEDKVLY